MKKIFCKIFGHKFRYNFGWMPSKAICKRCHKKWVATGSLMDEWKEVDEFENESRTDEEIIRKWVR